MTAMVFRNWNAARAALDWFRMKTSAALAVGVACLVLAGCASSPVGDPVQIERINEIMRTPARVENETPGQRELRAAREQAFGEKIGLLSAQDDYVAPHLVRHVAPAYPSGAAATGKTGGVMVGVIIDRAGNVEAAKVISSTDPVFESAAVAAVRQWRFTPGRKDGQLISMSFIFPVDFPAP